MKKSKLKRKAIRAFILKSEPIPPVEGLRDIVINRKSQVEHYRLPVFVCKCNCPLQFQKFPHCGSYIDNGRDLCVLCQHSESCHSQPNGSK